MLKILINAYACAPYKGSEPGMAWNWIINLAKHCEVFVITEGEWKQEIEVALLGLANSENIHFYYNPVSPRIRKMCWNQGDWRFYFYYRLWQIKTLKIAREICNEHNIDLVHQLNMIGFREPGELHKLKKPIIWGPVDAKEKFPVKYLYGASFKEKYFIRLKNFISKIQLKTWSRIRNAVNKSTVLLSASSQSVSTFKKFYNKDTLLMNETGCYISTQKLQFHKKNSNELNLLWVGKFDFRKQLLIAIKTLSKLKNKNHIKLNIVGGSNNEEKKFKKFASELGVDKQCVWHGKVPHEKVQQLMQTSDLLFFTSVAEGTPHVILEAIGNNLPVLCFNTCGQGDTVTDAIGIKIELSTPQQSIIEFAEKIDFLYDNPEILKNFSSNCKARQIELTWDKKAQTMVNLYKQILS